MKKNKKYDSFDWFIMGGGVGVILYFLLVFFTSNVFDFSGIIFFYIVFGGAFAIINRFFRKF